MSFDILSRCYLNTLKQFRLLLPARSLSSTTTTTTTTTTSLPTSKEKIIYKLTDQQVKKYYYLIKMIDHQHLYLINDNTGTTTGTTSGDLKLFDKINSEWKHKSQSDRNRLKEAFENIIYDMNQHKSIEIITDTDTNNNKKDIKCQEFHIMQYKYNQNQATGAIFSRKKLSINSILKYFIYSEINNTYGNGSKICFYEQDNNTKLKIINEIKRKRWVKLSSIQKNELMKQYNDLIMKGYEIDEKNDYQLIKINHDNFNIMRKVGEDDCFPITTTTTTTTTTKEGGGGNKVKYNTKWPTLIIKHNLTTGYCKIDGVSLLDGCDYYLWKNLFNQNIYDYEKYQIFKQKWMELTPMEQFQYQQEYTNILKSGKILLFGELQSITPKLIEESNVIKIKYSSIWGEQFKSITYKTCKTCKTSKTPIKLDNLRFLINQTVGNIIIIGKNKNNNKNFDYAWNYYFAKRLNQLQLNGITRINAINDNHQLIIIKQEWENMTQEEKSKIDIEYENLLLSGKDYLNGEIVTIKKKLSSMMMMMMMKKKNNNQGINLIDEIFGQDLVIPSKSRRGPGGYKVKTSIPVLIDQKSGKGILLDKIDLVYAYNYYFGLKLNKLKLGNDYDCEGNLNRNHHTVDNISQIENQWILMLEKDKLKYKSDYESLLRDGKDMLHGEIVSLWEKFSANKTISSKKISGQGLKRALFPKSNIDFTVKLISNDDDINKGIDKKFVLFGELSDNKLYQYYKYHRLQEESITNMENHLQTLQAIKSEWDEMNEQDKQEIRKAYELLLISGKDIKNNELIDIDIVS